MTANEWQLKEMTANNEKVALSQRAPMIVLTDTNTMFGFAGCNRFFGRYTTENNTIKLEPGGMTMMACPDLKFEDQFVKALAAMTTYSIENGELKLTDKDKKITLVFKIADKKVGVAKMCIRDSPSGVVNKRSTNSWAKPLIPFVLYMTRTSSSSCNSLLQVCTNPNR